MSILATLVAKSTSFIQEYLQNRRFIKNLNSTYLDTAVIIFT